MVPQHIIGPLTKTGLEHLPELGGQGSSETAQLGAEAEGGSDEVDHGRRLLAEPPQNARAHCALETKAMMGTRPWKDGIRVGDAVKAAMGCCDGVKEMWAMQG